MYKTAENIYDVIILEDQNVTGLAAGAVVTPATLEDGRVVVCDMSDRILSNATVVNTGTADELPF